MLWLVESLRSGDPVRVAYAAYSILCMPVSPGPGNDVDRAKMATEPLDDAPDWRSRSSPSLWPTFLHMEHECRVGHHPCVIAAAIAIAILVAIIRWQSSALAT